MQAIHINTTSLASESDASLLEAVLRMLAGVADVVAVRSLGIVSVLYDEHKIGPRTIVKAMRSTGYDAKLIRPSSLHRREQRRAARSEASPSA
ncbi:MAG: heavy-metal-associated domain-containing protein [Coriobacteriia bacterium]|nr:heavy-metal-associated domain-containing protein [Coriobacteriia bacterium]